MSDPISPIGGVSDASATGSRSLAGDGESGAEHREERRPDDPAPSPPARIDPIGPPPDPPRSRRAAFAAFVAQLLGQPGIKRGLRGGPETLNKARSAYLEAEWSGPSDRRLRTGRITKTEV